MRRLSVVALVVFAVALIVGARAATAQETESAKVPFPFVVGNAVMPAGSYDVVADDLDPSLLHIVSVNGRHSAFAVLMTDSTTSRYGDCELQFVRVGGRYYLSKIDTGSGSIEQLALPDFVEDAVRSSRTDH